MAKSEILIPTQLQQDRLHQLATAVSTAAIIDRGFPLKSDQFRKAVKGFALGAFRELKAEGLEKAASAIIYQAKK